jgi:hypothetical protein
VLAVLTTVAAAYALNRSIEADQDQEEEQGENGWQQVQGRERRDELAASAGTERREEGEEEEEDDDEDHILLVIPTGLSRPKPRTFYKGSDPEWQSFKSISQDRERCKRIRDELAQLIRKALAKHPSFRSRLGEIDTSKGSMWLKIIFPDGPPLEYERPGIAILDDLSVQRAAIDVDVAHHDRIHHTLFPADIARSLYLQAKVKAAKPWLDFRSAIGWPVDSSEKKRLLGLNRPPPALLPDGSKAPGSASPSTTGPLTASSAATTPQQQPEATSASSAALPQPSSTQAAGNDSLERVLLSLPPPDDLMLDLSTFRSTFLHRKSQRQSAFTLEPPRGAFVVRGLVDVVGRRAAATLDVTGHYDPNAGKYVAVSIIIREIQDMRQRPKGGP